MPLRVGPRRWPSTVVRHSAQKRPLPPWLPNSRSTPGDLRYSRCGGARSTADGQDHATVLRPPVDGPDRGMLVRSLLGRMHRDLGERAPAGRAEGRQAEVGCAAARWSRPSRLLHPRANAQVRRSWWPSFRENDRRVPLPRRRPGGWTEGSTPGLWFRSHLTRGQWVRACEGWHPRRQGLLRPGTTCLLPRRVPTSWTGLRDEGNGVGERLMGSKRNEAGDDVGQPRNYWPPGFHVIRRERSKVIDVSNSVRPH